jgi:hypothetical protein
VHINSRSTLDCEKRLAGAWLDQAPVLTLDGSGHTSVRIRRGRVELHLRRI